MGAAKRAKSPPHDLKFVCAFCKGKGVDPFDLLSPLAACQVCNGRGIVRVAPPSVPCAFCKATGVYPDRRLACTVCGGRGMLTAAEPFKRCPRCAGSGASRPESLPCLECGGTGVIPGTPART